jgi:hypothetical protein
VDKKAKQRMDVELKPRNRNHEYLYFVRITGCATCKHHDHKLPCRVQKKNSRECGCEKPTQRREQVTAFAGMEQVAHKLGLHIDKVVYEHKEIIK